MRRAAASIKAGNPPEKRRAEFLLSRSGQFEAVLVCRPAEDAAPISAYGITKLVVAKCGRLFARLGGPGAVSLRVANPFGPFQNPHRRRA